MDTSLQEALDALKTGLELKQAENQQVMQDQYNLLAVEIKSKGMVKTVDAEPLTPEMEIKNLLMENIDEITGFTKAPISLKSAPMLTTTSLVGEGVRRYSPNLAAAPNEFVSFAQLIPTVQCDTGNYIVPIETPVKEGDYTQPAEGADKALIKYNITMSDVELNFMAATVQISRKFMTNIPFISKWLPELLKRDMDIAQSTKFYNETIAVATASALLTGSPIERIINDIGTLMAASYMPDVIVVGPALYAELLLSTGAEDGTAKTFSSPMGTEIGPNGILQVSGINIFPAQWVAADKYLIFQSSYFLKVTNGGLSLQIFEETLAQSNEVLFRSEENIGFILTRPEAALFGDVTTIA